MRRKKSEDATTRPPLGGRVCFSAANGTHLGRSSDSQAAYLLQLPSSMAEPVLVWERSFLLTAAGQFRSFTGIPV